MKRTISILVIIAMMLASVLAIIPVGAAEGADGGDSVVEDTTPVGTPVATADEFKAAVEAGKDFYLTDNIILPADWTAKDFGATLDGNEKIITLTGASGLFATLKSATIKNVAVFGDVETTGGIAAGAEGDVLFDTVAVGIKTIKVDNAAGFVGKTSANLTFKNCSNSATISGTTTGGAFAGWVQGTAKLVFENCSNTGNVNANYAGGYVGAPQCGEIVVKNSSNGTPTTPVVVSGGSSYIGGLFGECMAVVNIDGLENYVTVNGGNYVGGIISKATKNVTVKNANIYETLNGGNTPGGGIVGFIPDGSNITFRAEKVTVNGEHNVKGAWNRLNGGFVGHVGHFNDAKTPVNTSSFYFVDCVMNAKAPTNNCNYGGFFGGHMTSTGDWYKILSFVRCVNNTDIHMDGNIGGFCGQGNAKEYYFEDCINNGNITSNKNMAGGFGGWGRDTSASKVTLVRCTNNGAITSSASGKGAAGFFAGRPMANYTFTDCINKGTITAGGTAAGFAVGCGGSVTFKTCQNLGALNGNSTCEFSDRGDQVIKTFFLTVSPTATSTKGPLMIDVKDTNDPEGDAWIAMVKDGDDASSIYVQINKTPYAGAFDIFTAENAVKQKDIVPGYYTIYLCTNDGYVTEILDGTLEVLAKETVYIADGIIKTPEDLLTMEKGGTYALGADITLPADFAPIDFEGSLDGDGYSITVTGANGPFKTLNNATVKNLTLKGKIDSTAGVGGLATTATGNVLIENVTVDYDYIKGAEISGFVQYVTAEGTTLTIKDCVNKADLTGTKKTAGFLAYTNSNVVVVIEDCTNNGNITRTCGHGKEAGDCSDCGSLGGAGFIANADVDSKITIKNSTNNGAVYGMGTMAGIAGYVFGTINLENCTNNGRVEITNKCTWLSSAAGLVGIFANGGSGTNVLTIKGCTNNSNIYFGDAGYEGGGGMVGSAKWNNSTEIYFEDCVNVGDLVRKNAGGHFGGFLGWASSIGVVSFKNCTNYGDIGTGTENNGGFLGQVGAKKAIYAENCTNYGDVTATTHTAGGFSGHCNDSTGATVTINGFTNYGTIISTNDTKAASACMVSCDSAANISIKNVTNYGYVSAKTSAAVAMAWGTKAVCENIVNNGKITGSKIVGADQAYFTNNGTFGEVIEINNAEDFLAMKPGFNYKLMNNIVLPEDYVGGTFGSQWYTCELDGNGKTIYMKGLKSPLFKEFHNVNVHDFKIIGTINGKAALAGEISNYASDVTVSNVIVDVDLTNNARIGGFIEWHRGDDNTTPADNVKLNVEFNNCAFLGNVTSTGGNRTGGFIAEWTFTDAEITFNNCVVGDKGLETAIKGNDGRVAGFVGKFECYAKYADAASVTFNNCVNYADVAHTGSGNEGASGAFGGRFVNMEVNINGSDNYGDISSNRGTTWIQGVGGLLGEANRNVTLTIDDSNNYGNVYARRSVVGGLVGAVTNASTATITNSSNFGNVENGKDWNFYAGGIVGSTNNSDGGYWTNYKNEIVVDNCFNFGTITTQNANIGGIVGGIEGAGNTALLSVTNCTNYGKMNLVGGNNVGGIIGQGVSGTKTIVDNNINYGYISGATGGNGVGGIMAHPYATAGELIVKNNANYGIVEGGANANVAGILGSWDAIANKYTYEGNVNYGTVIGVKNNTSGIVVSVADKADSSFSDNCNYGIVVCAEGNLLAPAIPETVKAENNYAGGVIVKTEANATIVKSLDAPYAYMQTEAGVEAWFDFVDALAAAEGVEIPDEPVVKPELATNPVDFTTLDYIIKDYEGIEDVSEDVYNNLFTTTKTAETLASVPAAGNTDVDTDKNAKGYFAKLLPITEDSYYELTLKAKNNRPGGYCAFVFAADAANKPYMVYGGLNNGGDNDKDKCELRASFGHHADRLSNTYFKEAQDLDENDYASYKVVYEGLTATVYTLIGGEWTQVTFGDLKAFTLAAGSYVAIGAYNRHGLDRQRTITITDAALTAPAAAPVALAAEADLSVEEALAALINYSALIEAEIELASMGEVAEDDAKAVALIAAIEAMEAATTQEEINNAATALEEKVTAYVDLTKLNYQLAQAAKLEQYSYTAATWADLVAALEIANNVDVTDQAAVDAAAAALDAALYGLADISELKDMTEKAIAKAEALIEDDFGSEGWAVMIEKLALTKAAYDAFNTDLMDIAVVELNAAMNALISVKELKALVAELSALDPANYSVVSLAAVAPAIAVAKTTLDPVTKAPVDNALELLRAAKAGLVDVTALNAAIAEAEDVNASRYTAVSYANLINVVASAKLVIMSAADAAAVEEATAAVVEAQKALRRKTTVSTDDLEALIDEAAALVADDYTAETWADLRDALSAAKVAVYADSQAKVRDAEEALQAAIDALEIKPALVTEALETLVAEIEALDFTKYTTETWSAVNAALIEAKVALKGDDQAAIDAAKAALDAAKAALAEKPVIEIPVEPEKPTEPEQPTEQPTEKPTEKPTEPAEEEGCGSAIGATVVVMTAVLGLGATVVLKKKED